MYVQFDMPHYSLNFPVLATYGFTDLLLFSGRHGRGTRVSTVHWNGSLTLCKCGICQLKWQRGRLSKKALEQTVLYVGFSLIVCHTFHLCRSTIPWWFNSVSLPWNHSTCTEFVNFVSRAWKRGQDRSMWGPPVRSCILYCKCLDNLKRKESKILTFTKTSLSVLLFPFSFNYYIIYVI